MQRSSFAHRPWWLLLGFLVIVWMVLGLAACAPGGTAGQGAANNDATQSTSPTTPTPSAGTTGSPLALLNGLVVAGPTCPVETADNPCPPKPVPNRQVTIETTTGKIVTTVTTDKDGRFSVPLAPGTYTLHVLPGSSPLPIQREPVTVTVAAGQTLSIQIKLDTGIR